MRGMPREKTVDGAHGPFGEEGAAVPAGLGHAVVHVVGEIVRIERVEFAVDEDALAELAEFVAFDDVLKLGLSHKDDLKELLFVGFEIGEEADLLEDFEGEILGLVDDEDDVAARARCVREGFCSSGGRDRGDRRPRWFRLVPEGWRGASGSH